MEALERFSHHNGERLPVVSHDRESSRIDRQDRCHPRSRREHGAVRNRDGSARVHVNTGYLVVRTAIQKLRSTCLSSRISAAVASASLPMSDWLEANATRLPLAGKPLFPSAVSEKACIAAAPLGIMFDFLLLLRFCFRMGMKRMPRTHCSAPMARKPKCSYAETAFGDELTVNSQSASPTSAPATASSPRPMPLCWNEDRTKTSRCEMASQMQNTDQLNEGLGNQCDVIRFMPL